MNERIRQLAIEAYEVCDKRTYGTIHSQEEFNQKFAELIVRECADQFKLVHTDEQYARRIDKTILKHFGLYQ